MKKYWLFAAAAVALMAGCSKKEMQPGASIDDTTVEAVRFNISAPSLVVTKTRGAGPVDAWTGNESLNILGFVKNIEADEYDVPGNILINNVAVNSPSAPKSGLLELKHPASSPYSGESFYYSSSKAYDFYGYYTDGAAGVNDLDMTDGVSLAIKIDGTQDVMAAKANPADDIKGNSKIPAANLKDVYSAWAARRGVHPTLVFEHLLSRFNFYVVAGSESAKTVKVKSISLASKTEAVMSIAPEIGLTNYGATKEDLVLAKVDPAGVTPYSEVGNTTFTYDQVNIVEEGYGKIGNSIMILPGQDTLNIKAEITKEGLLQEIEALDVDLMSSMIVDKNGQNVKTGFEAGKQYDIILTIYGPESVQITAVLSDWEEGGTGVIDPDDAYEVEPEDISVTLVDANRTTLTFEVVAPNDIQGVYAGLTETKNGVPAEWKEVVLTKSQSGRVTFYVDQNKDYYCHIKYAKGANIYTHPTVVPVHASNVQILGSSLVVGKDSYLDVPVEYRNVAWYEIKEDTLPWLVTWFMPMKEYMYTVYYTPLGSAVEVKILENRDNNTLADHLVITSADVAANTLNPEVTAILPGVWRVEFKQTNDSTDPRNAVFVVKDPAFSIEKAYAVTDKTSFNTLPVYYRLGHEWSDLLLDPATESALPWLAIEFPATKVFDVKLKKGEFTWTNLHTSETEYRLLTLSADELGITEDEMRGTWTVTINNYTTTIVVE